jgi:hypothetical protein
VRARFDCFSWPNLRVALFAGVLAFVALPGCARTKEPEQAAPKPSADPALAVCSALSGPGSLGARLAASLPLDQGGLLLVLEGTDAAAVERTLGSLGLAGTRVVGCGATDVVAWAPGVDGSGASGLESALLASAPATKTKERELLSPALGQPERKPKRD